MSRERALEHEYEQMVESKREKGGKVPGINHNYNQRARKLHQVPFGPRDSSWLYRRRMKIYRSTSVSFKVGRTTLHTSLFFHFFASFLAREVDSFALRYMYPPRRRKNGSAEAAKKNKRRGSKHPVELGTNTLSRFDELLRRFALRRRFRNFLQFIVGNCIVAHIS